MKKKQKAGTRKYRTAATSYRLSESAVKLLCDISTRSKLSKTEIVEMCLAKYALQMPEMATAAREALVEIITQKLKGAP